MAGRRLREQKPVQYASGLCGMCCQVSGREVHASWKGRRTFGGRTRISILGDAFEAVIGAIYLDNNYEVAARFILGHLKKFLDLIDQGDYDHDYKSDLQELAQKHGDVDIRYDVVRDEGPDHDKTIWMKIMINGKDFGTGVGKNKKEAAQKAAKEAIERIHKGERF